MEIHDVVGRTNFVVFAENDYRFAQDHAFFRGIPDGVRFYPVSERGCFIEFVGARHGVLPRHNLVGSYGNGSIHVFKDDIPHLTDWCKSNLLDNGN